MASYNFYLTVLSFFLLFLMSPTLEEMIAQSDQSIQAQIFRYFFRWSPLLAVAPLFGLLAAGFSRKRKELGVGLGRDGVYHWSWFGCSFFPWDEMAGAFAVDNHGPVIGLAALPRWKPPGSAEESWLSRKRSVREAASSIRAGHLAVDPAVVLYALAFYAENPDRRGELGTNTAIERLRKADFPGVSPEAIGE